MVNKGTGFIGEGQPILAGMNNEFHRTVTNSWCTCWDGKVGWEGAGYGIEIIYCDWEKI